MMFDTHSKVQARHLARNAYVYVRQSTLRQVLENTESTERQYALQQRARALGWQAEQVIVVDADLGQSGASSVDREGFQQLVSDVGMGHAGIVLGLEVSRLARNNADWHRLLEICALADTLILDEDGIYDPAHFNDRLLLGLKGTMSEAELHVLRARLIGGMLNKARRGELRVPLPVGLIYDETGQVVLDPDQQVQGALRLFFETFERVGTATATVKAFAAQDLVFPRRVRHGAKKGQTLWGELTHSRALWALHNPRYAGAFCYGRSRQCKTGTQRYKKLPRDQWIALITDAHPGYISWERHEANLEQLRQNSALQGEERRRSPPREGCALLQGIVICGRCGSRMTVRYRYHNGEQFPIYVCQREGIEHAHGVCQSISGVGIDQAISELVLEQITPLALEVALGVQQELQRRFDEADAQRHKIVERARYEADLAQRRYLRCEPENRLVATSLEAHWNEALRAVDEAQAHYEQQRATQRLVIDEQQRERIASLTNDFPALWQNPSTAQRDRKRMLRLLIEDVTLHKGQQIVMHVRFRGGTTQSLNLAIPLSAPEARRYAPELVSEIDRLISDHTDRAIAGILNDQGKTASDGARFSRLKIGNIRRTYHLQSRHDRLRSAGLRSKQEMAEELDISLDSVKNWRRKGWLKAVAYNDRPDFLYYPLGDDRPVKSKWKSRDYSEVTPQ